VLLVALEQRDDTKTVTVEERVVGRTTFERVEIDAASVESQPALVARLRGAADRDRVLDVRLIGVRPDELDLDPGEVEVALRPDYLRVRVRDQSQPPLTDGALPPAETIAGAFIRTVEQRIAALEASPDAPSAREAEELRDVLRLGRLLLAGREVTL
jgi:hypothetical protein